MEEKEKRRTEEKEEGGRWILDGPAKDLGRGTFGDGGGAPL